MDYISEQYIPALILALKAEDTEKAIRISFTRLNADERSSLDRASKRIASALSGVGRKATVGSVS